MPDPETNETPRLTTVRKTPGWSGESASNRMSLRGFMINFVKPFGQHTGRRDEIFALAVR